MEIVKRHCALFDLHIPHHINLSPVYAFIKEYRPTDFILGGDYIDCQYASHWQEKVFAILGLEKVSKHLYQEFEAGKEVLHKLDSILPKDCRRYYMPGNHELFLLWACMTYPALAGGVGLGINKITFKSDLDKIKNKVLADLIKKYLDTQSVNFKVLPYSKELQLGKITYVHGDSAPSINAMKKKYPARNIVAGHIHSEIIDTIHNSGDTRRANQYVFVPCLCNLSPGYLRDGSSRWLNAFWIADVLSTGHFSGQIVKVIDGCVPFNGKIFK